MLRRRKEETLRGVAGSLLTQLLGRAPAGVSGCWEFGSRPHSINKTIKHPPPQGSSRSTATAAMLT